MPRGALDPVFLSANATLADAEAFELLDQYTMEFFSDEPEFRDRLDLFMPLPPLEYDGVFCKGILFTQAADYLVERFPWTPKLFHVGAYSMWCSYPRSELADFYLSCYGNPKREAWFREAYPERRNKILIPLQDGDFTHEYMMGPRLVEAEDIDLLCVCKLEVRKNLGLLARAIHCYREKFGELRAVLISGQDLDTLNEESQTQLDMLNSELPPDDGFLEVWGRVPHHELSEIYSRSRCLILPSFIEGKNRSLTEAMLCNTPVLCLKEFNQHARGPQPAFPDGAGLTSPSDPDGVATTIHEVLSKPFHARKACLQHYGRQNFLNTLLASLPHYRQTIPEWNEQRPVENIWFDLAIQLLFQMSFHDYLYGDKVHGYAWVQGIEKATELLSEMQYRYNYKLEELS
jgi:glycosyltransferase involved in cell wall biosynthesis